MKQRLKGKLPVYRARHCLRHLLGLLGKLFFLSLIDLIHEGALEFVRSHDGRKFKLARRGIYPYRGIVEYLAAERLSYAYVLDFVERSVESLSVEHAHLSDHPAVGDRKFDVIELYRVDYGLDGRDEQQPTEQYAHQPRTEQEQPVELGFFDYLFISAEIVFYIFSH